MALPMTESIALAGPLKIQITGQSSAYTWYEAVNQDWESVTVRHDIYLEKFPGYPQAILVRILLIAIMPSN